MRRVDRITVAASRERVYAVAADVTRWPAMLRHYRWVRVLEQRPGGAVVEMAAWRPFGPLRYPTWWVSEMWREPATLTIRYRHLQGITRGMDVVWVVGGRDGAADVTVVHEWDGPRWPVIGRLAAALVIGPIFIHGIASRTLAGVKREAERVCDRS